MTVHLYPKDPDALDFSFYSSNKLITFLEKNIKVLKEKYRKIEMKGRTAAQFRELLFNKNRYALQLVNSKVIVDF